MTGADWDKLIAKLPEDEAAEYADALAEFASRVEFDQSQS